MSMYEVISPEVRSSAFNCFAFQKKRTSGRCSASCTPGPAFLLYYSSTVVTAMIYYVSRVCKSKITFCEIIPLRRSLKGETSMLLNWKYREAKARIMKKMVHV